MIHSKRLANFPYLRKQVYGLGCHQPPIFAFVLSSSTNNFLNNQQIFIKIRINIMSRENTSPLYFSLSTIRKWKEHR